MTDSNQSSTSRREFLAAGTTAGLALLAGCGSITGSSNSTNGTPTSTPIPTTSGPAQFGRAALLGPSTVTLGESFRLTLDVANVGGETGTLTTNIRVSDGRSTLDQPIEPGKSAKIQTDPIQFDIADSYTFSVGISKVSHTVSVGPKTAAFGKTFDLSDTLKATVKSIDFQPAVLYSPPRGNQTLLEQPSSNQLLAIVRVDLENVSSQSASLDSGFQLTNGKLRRTLGTTTPLSAAKIEGKPLTDVQLSAGQQRSGWLLGEIPRSKARKAVSIIYQRDSTGTSPELKWTNTPQQGTRDLPQFAIESFQLPNEVTEGENATANVTIANKGNSTRTFRGLIESRIGDSGNWGGVAPITSRVRPGQSIQQNVSINSSADGSVSYRLAPFNQTKTVEYVPPTVAFGHSYTTTENVEVTVSNLQTAKSVQISGKDSRRTPPSGKRFVLAKVQAVAVGESEGTPRSGEFALKANGRTFSQEDGLTNPLTSPVEGTPYGGVYDPNSGRTYSWYAVWTAPEQISTDVMTVQWTSREESSGVQGESARWTKGESSSR